MKLYLTKDIKNLGQKGELVKVSDGYGRNYLLRRNLASAQPVSVAKNTGKNTLSTKDFAKLQTLKEMVTLNVKANENGSLYAAVSPEDIHLALKAQYNIVVPSSMIVPAEPIKKLGEYQVIIKNSQTVIHTISVKVNPHVI
jgi:large subunit ribosomal protein L9